MMNRTQIFQRLREHGLVKVRVPFSGGNDEGYHDGIYGERADGGELDFALPEVSPELTDLEDDLAQPIFDRYGGFAGDFYVSGELVWNVADEMVTISGDEGEMQYESFSESV